MERIGDMPVNRPPVIRNQDKIDFRLTEEAEYRIPFTFIEALNEGTLGDRPAHAFLDAARERRLFHVLNQTTDNIIGTGVIQMASGSTQEAEVGGLLFHPGARGFGLAALLLKIMMVYAIKESGRDSPEEEYLAHVIDGNGAPLHALLDAGFKPIGPIEVRRGEIDAVIDHMIQDGESTVRMQGFVFDRHAIGRLVLALSKFVNEDQSAITRSRPEGDTFRITVDFSHVIPPAHLSM
ncbi:MAG TPA: GNAT family N-acetyltransferase [Chthoniobacterales bacterium]|nr:GNAT family N-acetyltransferase [Chthoniobacterales bacterium]